MSINILPASANYIADSLLYAYNWNWLAGRMGGEAGRVESQSPNHDIYNDWQDRSAATSIDIYIDSLACSLALSTSWTSWQFCYKIAINCQTWTCTCLPACLYVCMCVSVCMCVCREQNEFTATPPWSRQTSRRRRRREPRGIWNGRINQSGARSTKSCLL